MSLCLKLTLHMVCALALLTGCANFSPKHEAEPSSCSIENLRTPAAEKCEVSLRGRSSNTPEAREVSRKVFEWFKELETQFTVPEFDRNFLAKISAVQQGISWQQNLLKSYHLGNKTIDSLLRLGWKFQNTSDGEKRLVPPATYLEFYQKSFVLLTEGRKDYANDPTLILPCVVFSKVVGLKEIHYLARPGIDPIPNKADGWELTGDFSGFLKDHEFMNAISEGKFPISWHFIVHDPGHIVDQLESPQFAANLRRYYQTKKQFLASALSHKLGFPFTDFENLFNEFNYKVRAQSEKLAEEVFGNQAGGPASREKTKAQYLKKSLPELLQIQSRLQENFYKIFDTFGGGARDFTNELDTYINEAVYSLVDSKKRPDNSPFYRYVKDDISGMYFQSQKLAEVLTSEATFKEFITHLRSRDLVTDEQWRAKIQERLALLLAQIEFHTLTGLAIPLSPAQLVADLTELIQTQDLLKYQQSATFRFYSKVGKRGSLQWNTFVEMARRP